MLLLRPFLGLSYGPQVNKLYRSHKYWLVFNNEYSMQSLTKQYEFYINHNNKSSSIRLYNEN